MTHLIELPEDVAQRVAMLVASGRFRTVEDAVRAGMEAITEIAEDESAASEAAWSAYLARGASDPRDLSAREALACIGSDDPARQRALDARCAATWTTARGSRPRRPSSWRVSARGRLAAHPRYLGGDDPPRSDL